MKKQLKQFITILLITTCTLSLIGCGGEDFNPSAYIQAELDLMAKHDLKQYMEVHGVDEAQAEEDYNEVIEGMDISSALFDDPQISEEIAGSYDDWFINVLSKTKYTVLEAQKTEEGYTIEVEIEPLKAFEGLYDTLNTETEAYIEKMLQDIENGAETPSDAEINEAIYSIMLDILNDILQNPTYAEKVVIETRIIKNSDGDYEVDEDSFIKLGENLLDVSGLEE